MSGYDAYQSLLEMPVINIPASSRVIEGWDILTNKGYGDFEIFFQSDKSKFTRRDLGVLYFLRGWLKIFRCDPTALGDFQSAETLLAEPILLVPHFMQCLGNEPSLLRRVRARASSLFKYRVAIEKSGVILARLIQNPLCTMACSVIVAEAFYLNGKIPQAVSIALPVHSFAHENRLPFLQCHAGFVLIRCAIVMGDAVWFHHLLSSIAKTAERAPPLREISKRITAWVNATTGYLGVVSRYTVLPNGEETPNIDARIACCRDMGLDNRIAVMTDASLVDDHPIVFSDVFTHLFHAMMFFRHCELDEAVRRFAMADAVTRANRIYMPFAEYGDQIVPLLRYAMKKGAISRQHMNRLLGFAQTYEKGLRAIRQESADGERTGIPEGLFTKAERAVLRLMCEGKSNEEISRVLGNRPNTAAELARRVLRKMHVNNRREAIDKATYRKYFP